MAAPHIHTASSIKKWGGSESDYLAIHQKMDCSKAYLSDNRHRALTHHLFWVKEAMIPIFGEYIVNSDNKKIPVKDICEQHILEDFRHKFIPTAQDYLQEMEMKSWMNNGLGEVPSSSKKLYKEKEVSTFIPNKEAILDGQAKNILRGGPGAPQTFTLD